MPGLYVDLVSGTSLELQLSPSLPGWKNLEYSILKFSPETTKHILLPMKTLQAKHSLLVDPINKCIAPTNLGA
jgi:hypothetical protein